MELYFSFRQTCNNGQTYEHVQHKDLSLTGGEDESKDLCIAIRADWYNYKWEDPPIVEKVMGESIIQNLQINTSVSIYELINVDTSKAEFTVVFSIKMEWFDKRLTFGFLKEDPLKNNIEYYFSGEKKIWTPNIDFVMQADNDDRYQRVTRIIILFYKNVD